MNGEHLKKKRQWTNKQSDASLLAMSKELECLEQCCSRGHLNIFFLHDPQRKVKLVVKLQDTTQKSTTESLEKLRLHFPQRMGHLHEVEVLA